MFTLSKTRIMKRSLLTLTSSIAIVAGAFIAVKNIQIGVVEAAGDQAAVSSSGDIIQYDYNGGTYRYSVTVDGQTYNALCAEPSKLPPAGYSYSYSALNNNKIKLLVFLATSNSASANNLVSSLYGDLASTSDKRFAYIHATIGAINGDYNGLSENYSKIDDIANGTGSGSIAYAINNNSDAWLIAKNYTLYATNPSDSSYQYIVWIKSTPQYGAINVQKCDSETQSCTTPQGKASFAGIEFKVYNASSRFYDPNTKSFYDNGALITSGTTGADGAVTFSNLPVGVKYRVKETATNNSYLLTASAQTMSNDLTTNGTTLTFKDQVVRGDVKFVKTSDVDGEPMSNVVFKIKSTSGAKEEHLVVSDENGVVDTSASHASHKFHTNGYDNMEEDEIEYLAYGTWFGGGTADDTKGALPYDTYEITEMQCDANKFCYDIDSTKKTFTIETNGEVEDLEEWSNDCADIKLGTTATDADDDDKFIETGSQSVIKDRIEYCVMPGFEYTLKGILMDKATGKELLVEGRPITGESTISPAKECGSTTMLFKFDSTEFAGKDVVVFEKLYLGDEVVVSHENIEDDSQTVSVISLSTTATDNSDGDKILAYDQDVEIKDVVDYCLKEDMEFTIKGVVMNKNTKEPLLVDGKKVEQTITLTPDSTCGTTEIIYSLNTKDLGGTDLVIFEELYYGDELILSHSDFDNASQTVSVAPPPPDTGASTKPVDNGTLSDNAALIILAISGGGIGVYIGTRLFSRRKFLGGKR